MSPDDIIELPGQPGFYARRAIVDAWVRAGSPPVNSAGRLYSSQKYLYDGWASGKPGFYPADNPDQAWRPLAHVRFVALDINATPERVRALSAQGLVRPYSYEPWHWQLPGDVRVYPLVTSIPSTAAGAEKPFDPKTVLEASMSNPIVNVVPKYSSGLSPEETAKYNANNGTLWIGRSDGTFERYAAPFDPNVRNLIGHVFFGEYGDKAPTINPRDFQTVQRLWKVMCSKAPA